MPLQDQRGAGEQRDEVQRILYSPQFRRAPKLQRFLKLVCDYHFQNRSADINEYLIATQAFGKGQDFDPSQDSLVRVQAREIRRRLREYYQSEGASSRLILDLPVGHYAPVFTRVDGAFRRREPVLRGAWLVLAGTVLICAALLIAADHERRLLIRSTASAAEPSAAPLNPPLAALWGRFLNSDTPTMLVVSNPDVGCEEQRKGSPACADEYTGMGEAVAIHLITALFRSAKQTLLVKESRIVSGDDIKRYNLVLLGGKGVNIWTRRLGEDLSLAEPSPGQEFQTVFDAKTRQITRDRAIVALRKHPATGRWVLFLWGRHSQGTHAAAEACTDERFLSQLKWPASPFPDSFHVLVGVSVTDGIPERAVPVAVHVP